MSETVTVAALRVEIITTFHIIRQVPIDNKIAVHRRKREMNDPRGNLLNASKKAMHREKESNTGFLPPEAPKRKLSPIKNASDHGSVSVSVKTTATENSSSLESLDRSKRLNSLFNSPKQTTPSLRESQQRKQDLSSKVIQRDVERPHRRASLPAPGDVTTPRSNSGASAASDQRTENKLKELSKSEHVPRTSRRMIEGRSDRPRRTFNPIDTEPVPRSSRRAERGSSKPCQNRQAPCSDALVMKSKLTRRSRSRHRTSRPKAADSTNFGCSPTGSNADNESAASPPPPTMVRQGSFRRRRSRSRKRNDMRDQSIGQPNVRRNSIGRWTNASSAYRATAATMYGYDVPNDGVQEKLEGAFERRMRRHSLNASNGADNSTVNVDMGSISMWKDDFFTVHSKPGSTKASSSDGKHGPSVSLGNDGGCNFSRSPVRYNDKAEIQEASLLEILRRVGISCTDEQVEKLELLGVMIQRK